MKISVIIPTLNEETFLPGCLRSVSWADEVIVIDAGSKDKTRTIAKESGAKVISHKWSGFSVQKNIAAKIATGDWLLFVDADERVSQKLQKEIRMKDLSRWNILKVPRKNYIYSHFLKHGGWFPDYQRRLVFRPDFIRWYGTLHENIEVKEERLGILEGHLIHFTHRGTDWALEKTKRYTFQQAVLFYKSNHPPVKLRHFIAAMGRAFWQRGIVKQGWKDGILGWIEIIYQTFNTFLIYLYLWEIQQKKSQSEQYRELDKNSHEL